MGFLLVHIPPSKQFTDTIQNLSHRWREIKIPRKSVLIAANTLRGLKTKHISLGEKAKGQDIILMRDFNFFSIVRSRSTKINQAYLFRFKCKLNKYLLQLFIDKVDGKLLKLIVLKKENGACVNNS